MSRRGKLIAGIVLLVVGVALIGWNLRDSEAALRAPKEERKVTIEEVPAAVQATIKREATASGTVKEVEEKLADGKTTYEVDILRAGYAIELDIDATGKVLERDVEKEKPKKK